MRSRRSLAAVTVLVAVSLSGCTIRGTPVAASFGVAPPATTTTTSEQATPRVAVPLDVARFVPEPCGVLSSDKSVALGLQDEGHPTKVGNLAPYCTWQSTDRAANYTVGFEPENEGGLSDSYRANKSGHWEYFEPTEVAGYPAVFEDLVDRRTDGYCTIIVAVRDELTYSVSSRGGPGREACGKVKDIAGEVLTTLRSGA